MPILARFAKQPDDRQDFDIDYTEWLLDMADTAPGPTGLVVVVEDGITLSDFALDAGVVKVWLSGGVDGTTYKVTATVTTEGGRIKQTEIKVRVKEY